MTKCVVIFQLEIPQIPYNLFGPSAQIVQLFRIFLKKVVIMAMVEENENNLIWIASGNKMVGTVTYYCNQVSALWVGWWLRYAFRVHWHQVQKYSSSFLFWHIYIHTLTEVHHIPLGWSNIDDWNLQKYISCSTQWIFYSKSYRCFLFKTETPFQVHSLKHKFSLYKVSHRELKIFSSLWVSA